MELAAYKEMRDAGRRKGATGTERLCVATAKVKPVEAMIRFVVGPNDAIVPDVKRRLPGRGVWVTATRDALHTAIARKAFARAFKRNLRVGADLIEVTERLLEKAALDALAIARKAGRVTIGFSAVSAALAHEPVVTLVHAAEAAPDGRRKLAATLGRRKDTHPEVIDVFTSAQLGLALGQPNVIHAALLAGPESETFVARTARLACFRTELTSGRSGDGPERQADTGSKELAPPVSASAE
jgi:predicted RNA-binding protein YlxR (DUF448 family)